MNASNSLGTVGASCVLSVVRPPGTNWGAPNFTNYAVAGVPLVMSGYITNIPAATNTYLWFVRNGPIGVTTTNLNLSAAQVVPTNSATYTLRFNSVNGTNIYAKDASYDSYWQFGWRPSITNQPTAVTSNPGSNAVFNFTLNGSSLPNILTYKNVTIETRIIG